MLERHLLLVRTEAAGAEEPKATRERLRDAFPPGATRRMSQLGLLLGSALADCLPDADGTLVYASSFAETRALESYLESFPAPSPTFFQNSIHPSAVQQSFVARRRPVRSFFPHTGGAQLVAHAVRTALLDPAPRVVLCGGEERGTWLREEGIASEASFAFAAVLARERAGAAATLALEPAEGGGGELTLPEFFAALRDRRPIDRLAAPGLRLVLSWH